jgi:hypothetical protein
MMYLYTVHFQHEKIEILATLPSRAIALAVARIQDLRAEDHDDQDGAYIRTPDAVVEAGVKKVERGPAIDGVEREEEAQKLYYQLALEFEETKP